MLVEDNEIFRETLELLLGLRPTNQVVDAWRRGTGAGVRLELAPDVVLMDYRMPGLNGAQATGRRLAPRRRRASSA